MSQCHSCELLRLNSTPVGLFLFLARSTSNRTTYFLLSHLWLLKKRKAQENRPITQADMGKRKSAKKPQTGKRGPGPLESVFTCVFCNNPQAITVKMDQKLGTGFLACKVCGQKFASDINVLSAPIDVYTDWLDKCHEINEARQREIPAPASRRDTNANSDRHGSSSPAPPSARKRRDRSDRSDDEEDRQPVFDRDEEDRPRKSSSGKKRKVEKKKSKHTTYSDFSDEEDF
ncbi:Uncharacterized Zn ribbon-containing protein [Phaffia rhodozyma]|uniref:Transcription elongation factor 1 homolog n=1 Tax=Phaffia rhodozyma TaxID=264483 RepID=A0A0F7SWP5_PHARH|nr:Uncharacterized Zn ribbon-containing protein [Phaffia rhodozyma]